MPDEVGTLLVKAATESRMSLGGLYSKREYHRLVNSTDETGSMNMSKRGAPDIAGLKDMSFTLAIPAMFMGISEEK